MRYFNKYLRMAWDHVDGLEEIEKAEVHNILQEV